MKNRAKKVAIYAIIVICLLIAYFTLHKIIGFGIPCIFFETTGLLCGGCGVTRMLTSLLKLDFASAFYYNCAYMCLIPFWVVAFSSYIINYIKYDTLKMKAWHNVVLISSIAILVLFTVLRNIIPLGLCFNTHHFNFGGII